MAARLPIRLRTLAAATVVIASGLIIFNGYQSIINSSEETPQALPIIYADTEPFRVLPEDPGGMEIINKDSTLFDVMDEERDDPLLLDGVVMTPEKDDDVAETILPEDDEGVDSAAGFSLPEIPEKRTESLYGMIEDLKDRPDSNEKQVVEVVEESEEIVPLEPSETAELKEKLKEVIAKVEKEEASEEGPKFLLSVIPTVKPSVPVAKAKSKPVEKVSEAAYKPELKKQVDQPQVATQAPTQPRYYIQLASLRDENEARSAYERIRDDFPNVVRGLGVDFPKVDLGARGTFTRIQVGPLSETEAKKRCADYTASARGGTCLVISR